MFTRLQIRREEGAQQWIGFDAGVEGVYETAEGFVASDHLVDRLRLRVEIQRKLTAYR
jgi:hypothetical protein